MTSKWNSSKLYPPREKKAIKRTLENFYTTGRYTLTDFGQHWPYTFESNSYDSSIDASMTHKTNVEAHIGMMLDSDAKKHFLGFGSFGAVLLMNNHENEKVAVKISKLAPKKEELSSSDPSLKSNIERSQNRAKREIKILELIEESKEALEDDRSDKNAQNDHIKIGTKFVLKFIEAFYPDDSMSSSQGEMEYSTVSLVTEYCENSQTLHKFIKEDPEKKLSIGKAGKFTFQLLQGLAFLHKFEIIHRDIKPDNLLIVKKSDLNHETHIYDLKIIDFNLAVKNDVPRHTTAGSNGYKAPEINVKPCDVKYYDTKVDIYSAGICLIDMRFGVSLRSDEKRGLRKKEENYEVKNLLEKMLEKNHKNRWTALECLNNSNWLKNLKISNNNFEFDELKWNETGSNRSTFRKIKDSVAKFFSRNDKLEQDGHSSSGKARGRSQSVRLRPNNDKDHKDDRIRRTIATETRQTRYGSNRSLAGRDRRSSHLTSVTYLSTMIGASSHTLYQTIEPPYVTFQNNTLTTPTSEISEKDSITIIKSKKCCSCLGC